ncbi:MAG: hypothetical protein H6618_10140 [Deltaproteobacteria bacterium]|nr:hypothetical protein [Deltaproteobacteria bacterium]
MATSELRYRIITGAMILLLQAAAFQANKARSETEQITEHVTEKLSLEPGASATIRGQGNGDLLVSKKGILDIFHIRDVTWKITALREGLVSIRSGQSQWMVTVTKTHKKKAEDEFSIPDWICTQLNCDQQKRIISGQSSGRHEFIQALRWCQKHSPCLFTAQLEKTEKERLFREAEDLLRTQDASCQNSGGLRVCDIPCNTEKQELTVNKTFRQHPLTNPLLKAGLIALRCRQPLAEKLWSVKAKIYFTSQHDSVLKGFDHSVNLSLRIPGDPTLSAGLMSRLEALLAEKHARVIGEPLIVLRQGTQGEIQSGGEIPVMSYAKNQKSHDKHIHRWKSFGLKFQVRVTGSHHGKALIQYSLRFRQPTHGEKSTFNSEKISSEISAPLAVPVLAGQTSIHSDMMSDKQRPFLATLPLVGPLFKSSSTTDGQSGLWVWVEVAEFVPDKNHPPLNLPGTERTAVPTI